MVKAIAVLTSGGDAPGMNAAIRAVVRTCLTKGITPYGVTNGYKGLYDDNIIELAKKDTHGIINRGGTILRTARFPEFKDIEYRKVAVSNLKKRGIDGLVVVGGDGSFMGAKLLSELGILTIALPGTIDNDIASSDYTIGFDTALNTVIEAIDRVKDTSESHQRCSILEVMGRYCGDIAIWAGVASGVSIIVTNEFGFNKDEVIERLNEIRLLERRHAIVVITEGITDVHEFAKEVEKRTGFDTRANVLGHLQRGGSPSGFDRVLGSRMGVKAVSLIEQGIGSRCVGIKANEMADFDIEEALKMTRKPSEIFEAFTFLD